MATKPSPKAAPFATKEHLTRWGGSKGYVFRKALLERAKVDTTAEFNVEVSDHVVVFRFLKRKAVAKPAGKITPKPLSYYFNRMPAEPYVTDEVFPADEARGKERV